MVSRAYRERDAEWLQRVMEGDVRPDCGGGFRFAYHWPQPSPDGGGGEDCTGAGCLRHRNGIDVVLITQQDAADRMTTRMVSVTNDAPYPSRYAMRVISTAV